MALTARQNKIKQTNATKRPRLISFAWYARLSLILSEQGGAWVAQSVKHLTLAQVMILQFVASSPTVVSVWTAQSLEPASDSVYPTLSASPLLTFHVCPSLSPSLSKINKTIKIFFLKCLVFIINFKKFFQCLLIFERERERDRIPSRLQTPSCQHRAPPRA